MEHARRVKHNDMRVLKSSGGLSRNPKEYGSDKDTHKEDPEFIETATGFKSLEFAMELKLLACIMRSSRSFANSESAFLGIAPNMWGVESGSHTQSKDHG